MFPAKPLRPIPVRSGLPQGRPPAEQDSFVSHDPVRLTDLLAPLLSPSLPLDNDQPPAAVSVRHRDALDAMNACFATGPIQSTKPRDSLCGNEGLRRTGTHTPKGVVLPVAGLRSPRDTRCTTFQLPRSHRCPQLRYVANRQRARVVTYPARNDRQPACGQDHRASAAVGFFDADS